MNQLVFNIPLENASVKYFVETKIDGDYVVDNGAHQDHFGSAKTLDIDIFGVPRVKGSNQLEIVKIDYVASSVQFQ